MSYRSILVITVLGKRLKLLPRSDVGFGANGLELHESAHQLRFLRSILDCFGRSSCAITRGFSSLRDVLKYSLHPILKKLGLEQGGLNTFRRFRITKLETAEVPAALQHTWSGHAKSHVSEVFRKVG